MVYFRAMKFKKHISLTLAFFLLVSNMGFAIDVHYCGEKIASIQTVYWENKESLVAIEKGCCPDETTNINQEEDSCCKDKLIHLEKKYENVTINPLSFHSDFNFLMQEWNPILFGNSFPLKNSRITSYYFDANAPPLFKLYHQYIFYA
jgi:hypothetical protein